LKGLAEETSDMEQEYAAALLANGYSSQEEARAGRDGIKQQQRVYIFVPAVFFH
jgi:hypothetical protein